MKLLLPNLQSVLTVVGFVGLAFVIVQNHAVLYLFVAWLVRLAPQFAQPIHVFGFGYLRASVRHWLFTAIVVDYVQTH